MPILYSRVFIISSKSKSNVRLSQNEMADRSDKTEQRDTTTVWSNFLVRSSDL